ncbi:MULTISPECIES: hypothetical protein [Bacteria]|uniref:hypothetical protein n=1 Tax=Bacteria TaxID=2 RepID=UPI003F36EBD9
MESKVFLFVRKSGVENTNILEIDRKEAIKFVKENYRNKNKFQVGILTGSSYDSIKSVYGEYAPFKKVYEIQDLEILIDDKKYVTINKKILDRKELEEELYKNINKISEENFIKNEFSYRKIMASILSLLSKDIPTNSSAEVFETLKKLINTVLSEDVDNIFSFYEKNLKKDIFSKYSNLEYKSIEKKKSYKERITDKWKVIGSSHR